MVLVLLQCYILEMLAEYQIIKLSMKFKTYNNTGTNIVKFELSQFAGGRVNWYSPFRQHLGDTHQSSYRVLGEEENCHWDFWPAAYLSLHSWTCTLCFSWACFLTVFRMSVIVLTSRPVCRISFPFPSPSFPPSLSLDPECQG